MPCTTTNIDSTYHRFPDPASRVDFAFYFVPDNDPTLSQPPTAIPCFNWTSDRMLQQYPLAFSIETKRYGGNAAKGEQQMGIWHAAQWDFLITRAGADAVAKLEFLPGIVIQGHIWSLVITTRNEGTTP
uniref:PD-(D/E)XK nuclease-like domain-containing protein n=1 Tax=Fusarium oxysporum (strain Fo5176) TaxID=660025 RepID=A0A0D2YFA9_FUSOF